MRILFYSSHEILEFDLVKLFTEMGHEVFSLGAFQVSKSGTGMRGEIPGLYENAHLQAVSITCDKENTSEELLAWADVIFMMHNSRTNIEDHPQPWLNGNWDKIKKLKKPCIWYSIGQSSRSVEESLHKFRKEGLRIVRYSPKEELIPKFAGQDAMIRFYKDPDEYLGYNGEVARIANLSQGLFGGPDTPSRGDHMDLPVFKQVVKGLDWKVFGRDNENAGEHNGGSMSFEDMKQMLRFNRMFLYMGTRPALYTLAYIEAAMTGMPIVSVGPVIGNSVYTDQKTFEVPELIGPSGEAGFWSDSPAELRDMCQILLNDKDRAIRMGMQGRARAISIFGKQKIEEDWESFFKQL